MTHHHKLPISTGYGGGTVNGVQQPTTVYCGRCRASVPVDQEWFDRWAASYRRRAERDGDRKAAEIEIERVHRTLATGGGR